MIGESLLLLKGHSRSHMTCKALCPFLLKCIVVVVRVTRLSVNKYEESSVVFTLFLNCCKLGNCVVSLAKPFMTVIDSSLRVVFAFLT